MKTKIAILAALIGAGSLQAQPFGPSPLYGHSRIDNSEQIELLERQTALLAEQLAVQEDIAREIAARNSFLVISEGVSRDVQVIRTGPGRIIDLRRK